MKSIGKFRKGNFLLGIAFVVEPIELNGSVMIGVIVDDGCCPIQLFQKDNPGQFVGQGHGTEAKKHCTLLGELFGQAIGPTQHKARSLARVFQP